MIRMMQYIHELGPLFEAVQMQQVFPDGKTFPDCLPKGPLEDIFQAYLSEKDAADFDLQAFVAAHFEEPTAVQAEYQSDRSRPATAHVAALWPVLTRQPDAEQGGSLLALPHPYIVPGGRFREIYYWDSYFTMLGLQQSGRSDLMQHMVDNFAHLIERVGYIPNGNRAYYLGRSQPPFFALMVGLLAEERGHTIWANYLSPLEREYEFWMHGLDQNLSIPAIAVANHRVVHLPDGSVLNRYWDEFATPRPESYREDVELVHESGRPPEEMYRHIRAAAESGWDFSSRWFREPQSFASIHTTDLIPVDLNCLLWFLEKKLAEIHESLGDEAAADRYYAAAVQRVDAIQQYHWNEEAGFYFDFDFQADEPSQAHTLAAVFPLFFNLAPMDAAERVAQYLKNHFLQTGGLVTTLHRTGQQWDAPNGWAPLQWMAYRGLLNYGQDELAARIRAHWTENCLRVYQQTGKMMEKYNVLGEGGEGGGGEYPNQDGFGWTNGVLLRLLA